MDLNIVLLFLGSGCCRTEGIIIANNSSLWAREGLVYHGGFFVTSVNPSSQFSCPGDSGAAVTDVETGMLLGLVEAVHMSYDCHVTHTHYDHVTFCLPLYPLLKYFSRKTRIQLGHFRTLD